MNRLHVFFALLSLSLSQIAQVPRENKLVSSTQIYERKLELFHLDEVQLNKNQHPSQFIENRDKFLNELAKTNPDDFLYMFRNAFGQEQPKGAKALGVWDSQEIKLRGHATGHYLSALAQAYAGQKQEVFRAKMEYVVDELYRLANLSGKPVDAGNRLVELSNLAVSEADPSRVPPADSKGEYNSDLSVSGIRTDYWNWGSGYISAFPPYQFIMLEMGANYGSKIENVLAQYYNLHKILAGLLDVYQLSGNRKALQIVVGMGDWVHTRLSRLPDTTLTNMWNLYIAGEFGGMNEVMARLSRISCNAKYMETAHFFDNTKVFFGDKNRSGGLAKNEDLFKGLHANQHIPQMLGALEMFRSSGDSAYYQIASNFWKKIRYEYMYSIGGVAGASTPDNPECFPAEPSSLFKYGFSQAGQNETCATYNLLKLAGNLFLHDQRTELMDYYERGLYNHILASVAEDSPANTYHVPLRPGSVKDFTNARMDGYTCCNGTAMESNTKFQQAIYFKSMDNESLYVNLFIPSTLNWKEKGIRIVQQTAYPEEDLVRFEIQGNGTFNFHLRIPEWCKSGVSVKVNGRKMRAEKGQYLCMNRQWHDGDQIELRLPFSFYLEPVMDQPTIASLFYGPVLLAAQEPGPLENWRKLRLNARNISKSIQSSADGKPLHFTIDGVLFKPFYQTYGPHSVYLDFVLE